jgi:hypothetical protein
VGWPLLALGMAGACISDQRQFGEQAYLRRPRRCSRFAVGISVGALEVIQQLAAPADHAQETAARVVVLLVFFEVTGEVVDAGGKQRYLDFGRTGVASGTLVLGHDLSFLLNSDRHVKLSFVKTAQPQFDRADARWMKVMDSLGEANPGF